MISVKKVHGDRARFHHRGPTPAPHRLSRRNIAL
jgi:hypothetical protein